jgi:membrane associated rhomboid family serine protease
MFWLMPWDADHPCRHSPWATWTLIALNVLVYLSLLARNDPAAYGQAIERYGLVAVEAHWYQFVAANFLHADFWHLLFNMLFLYVFGDNVEDVLGPAGMLLLYFAGGFFGDVLFVAANPQLSVPTVGASGCIATLAGAYAVLFFRQRVGVRLMLLVFPIHTFHLQAIWVLLLWFGLDVFLALQSKGAIAASAGVNFVSHGVGFATGFLLGVFATLHGVMRRFERLATGDAWFGYWPSRLEDRRARKTRR